MKMLLLLMLMFVNDEDVKVFRIIKSKSKTKIFLGSHERICIIRPLEIIAAIYIYKKHYDGSFVSLVCLKIQQVIYK